MNFATQPKKQSGSTFKRNPHQRSNSLITQECSFNPITNRPTQNNFARAAETSRNLKDPLPTKLTNDPAEFSFRGMAMARMKFGDGRKDNQTTAKRQPQTMDEIRTDTMRNSKSFKTEPKLPNGADKRLRETLHNALKNPASRVYQPTFTGFLADQMSP